MVINKQSLKTKPPARGGKSKVKVASITDAGAMLTPVGKDTLSERVYHRLSVALMTGEFKPGESITLRDAAQRLGTSVMPVRDAVGRLITQHAIILRRNKAVQIPSLSTVEFQQLWHLRGILEGEACAIATASISRAEFAALSDLVAEAIAAAAVGNMRPIILHAYEFLFRIYRATQNSVLVSMIEMLWLRTGPLYFNVLESTANLSFIRKSLKNNAKLLDCLKAGNAEAARETRRADLIQLAQWLESHRETTH